MSIAEKLTAIAENQQKVYDAGFAAGQATGGGAESLSAGYLKVDPTWTNFSYLCSGRPSMVANLKYSDTANGTNFLSMFNNCKVKTIPSLDLRKGTNFGSMFIYSGTIEEIGEMDISGATTENALDYMFLSCSGLKTITFVSDCIKATISFAQSSQLTKESIQSIMRGACDDGVGKTLTLSKTAVDNAFAGGYGGTESDIGSETYEWDDMCQGLWMNGWTITLV